MREFNALHAYDRNTVNRVVSPELRTIENRLIASERGSEYYDGSRANGFGGYVYNNSWRPVARSLISDYGLLDGDSVLHIGSDKGFLLHDLLTECSSLAVYGIEPSAYACENTMETVKTCVLHLPFGDLPFEAQSIDLIVCSGPIYTLNLPDAVHLIREIVRVTRRSAYVTLASYNDVSDFFLFRNWSLLGTTILKEDEWRAVLSYCGYTFDYSFVNSNVLKLNTH